MEEPPAYNKESYAKGFNAPGSAFGVPGQGYAVPGQEFGAPGQAYGAPGQAYGAPGQAYGAPGQAYGVPGQAYRAPGQAYGAPAVTNVMFVPSPSFGAESVTTVCRHCQANISTSTSSETGIVAYISAALICAIGCWCCFWIPLTMDNLKDVTHKCPNCNAVVGRYKAKI